MRDSKSVKNRVRELNEIIKRAESRIKANPKSPENRVDQHLINNAKRTLDELALYRT